MQNIHLSGLQKELLIECRRFAIIIAGGKYLRLGGHGESPVRFHERTIYVLRDKGLVTYDGYWRATPEGVALTKSLAGPEAG